tara:strand:- start:10332 stop:11360 length:1029 start_codon:yes stop_codon:yes gene_type:complete
MARQTTTTEKAFSEAKKGIGVVREGGAKILDALANNGIPQATGVNAVCHFPLDVLDSGRPLIRFACHPSTDHHPMDSVSLPCPQGLTFGDSATYATIDVGTLAAVGEVVQAGVAGFGAAKNNGEGNAAAAKQAATESLKDSYRKMTSGGIGGAAILAARKIGMDSVAGGMEFAAKQVVNPRTNTTFAGNTLRNFQFDFKMIAKSPQEVDMIHQIHTIFRNNLYAAELGGESIMLKYPNQWEITFVDPIEMKELKYIPKIYRTYLTGLNTVVNSTANTFHKDMAPYEIDVALQFQETKILTRNEMEDLQLKGVRKNKDEALATQGVNNIKSILKKGAEFIAPQ